MAAKKQQAQLKRWYDRQDGLCHWCGCEMLPPGSFTPRRGVKTPTNLCTYDHMDSRLSADRGRWSGHRRNVAACWQCNHDRNVSEHSAMPIDELRRRASHSFTP